MAKSVQLKGFSELRATLRELPPAVAKNTLRAGVLSAAVIVRNAAREKAAPHMRTGVLNGSIIVKYAPEQSSKTKVTYLVLVRHGKGEVRNVRSRGFDVTTGQRFSYKMQQSADAFYWWWVEFGKHNKHHQAAMPYMRPAFLENVDASINTMGETIAKRLPQAVQEAKK